MKKQYRMQIFFGVVTLLLLLLAFTSATYAWFTFSNDTNVEPLEGGIGYGEGDLTIANDPAGPFSEYCELNAIESGTLLRPLSTADLNSFFTAIEHNRSGISIRFAKEDKVDTSAVCGSVYLKSEQSDCDVYFDSNTLDFGSDGQALASMRLGLVITTQKEVFTHIFRLDDMGGTANAEANWTIEQHGAVLSSVGSDGRPYFVNDPAEDLSGYFAAAADDPDAMSPGEHILCRLSAGEAAKVDFYLYLEGCDENCINVVQGKQLALALGFVGFASAADAA